MLKILDAVAGKLPLAKLPLVGGLLASSNAKRYVLIGALVLAGLVAIRVLV